MATRTGRLGNVTFTKETTWGNFASATMGLRVSTESLNRAIEHVEDPSLIGQIFTTDMIKIADGIGGTMEGALHGDDCGYLIYGVLGDESSAVVNPIKAGLLISYNGTADYARITKSGSTITAETSTNGSSWTVDTNFSSLAGAIDVTGATLDTLTELVTYISGRTGYDAVIIGNSADSSTLADFTATNLRAADVNQGSKFAYIQPTSSAAKTHIVSPADATASLPSFSLTINRTLGTNESVAAVGAKISQLSITNTAKDLCKFSITVNAKAEEESKADSGVSLSAVEAYLAANMKIVMEEADGTLTEFDEVKDFGITINSNLDENNVLGSFTKLEQERQASTIEISFTANNTTAQYGVRDNYTGDTPVGLIVYFKGNDYADSTNLVPYNLFWRFPAVKLTNYNSPLSTPDRLTITASGTVVKPASSVWTEHCTVYVIDTNTTVY